MSDEHEQVLADELEVLESIYIDELEKISKDELRIRVEPEEDVRDEKSEPIVLALHVTYTPAYPDELPEMEIEEVDGELGEEGKQELMRQLREVGEESLGMAMVFTLASHLREALTEYVQRKVDERNAEENKKKEAELEAEAEKFRGTAVTVERFAEWKKQFEAEQRAIEQRAEDEKMRLMSAKEREEYKKSKVKPSGRQLFERGQYQEDEEDKNADADDAQEVDWDLYSREERERQRLAEEEEAEGRIRFEDSDED